MGTPWRWEARDVGGRQRTSGGLDHGIVWWAQHPDEVADFCLAQMMVRARPNYRALAGWTVTAWRKPPEGEDPAPEDVGVAEADEWLRILNKAA